MGINSLTQQIGELKNAASGFIVTNPLKSAAIGAVSAGAIVGGATALISARKKSSRKRKKSSRKSTRKRSTRRRYGKRRTPRTAGKRKDRSHKRIRYTKRGQPYIILKSGKARFIKLSSAKRSHKLKGGRY